MAFYFVLPTKRRHDSRSLDGEFFPPVALRVQVSCAMRSKRKGHIRLRGRVTRTCLFPSRSYGLQRGASTKDTIDSGDMLIASDLTGSP